MTPMTWTEGRRVRLAADLRVGGAVTLAESAPAEADTSVGTLFLAAGTGGTVVRVDRLEKAPGPDVREYERLHALLADFGHQMPPGSRQQLVEQVAALEPAWTAYQEEQPRATVRVRLDNGFVLADAREDLFAPE
ncbi:MULTISPECIES: hypothetical protein [Streptomyces]|uniref:hypothetical protein n=2 Tax=Streptomyces TaxID=1883 RepID=UPI000AC74348|nr:MULTISPECIES: hypothetical protein [Streptomyces]